MAWKNSLDAMTVESVVSGVGVPGVYDIDAAFTVDGH
jgi:hypothetical protein